MSRRDLLTLVLIVSAFVGGGSVLMAFQLLPEDQADDFHALSAGNLTFQSDVIMMREPSEGDDTTIYAVNKIAADAVSIALQDDEVEQIIRQTQGQSVTIAGVQPTLLVDSNGNLIHSSVGQVMITANQERIGGIDAPGSQIFSDIKGKQGIASQQIWTVHVDLDRSEVISITSEPVRSVTTTIQDNLVVAEMNMFLPRAATVESGSTVRWFNESNIPHNVVGTYLKNSTSVHIDSGFFERDGRFQYAFDETGVFEYSCTIHSEEGMKGILVIAQ